MNIDERIAQILDGLHESGCSYLEGLDYPQSQAVGMYKCDCIAVDAPGEIKKLIEECKAL